MQRKKLLVFLLILFSLNYAFVFLACQSSSIYSKEKKTVFKKRAHKIGLLIHIESSDESQYYQEIFKNFLSSEELTFFIENTQRSKISLNSAVESLISNDIDILITIQNKDSRELIQKISPHKIPIIFYHFKPTEAEQSSYNKISVLAPENEKIGTLQADYLIKSLADKHIDSANIALLTGKLEDAEQILRSNGFRDYIQKNSNLKITQSQPANWESSEASTLVEKWLLSDNLAGIVANNDAMILGASIALREQEISDIILIGAGGRDKVLQYISKSYITSTVLIDDSRGLELCLETAARMLQNIKYNKKIEIPITLVDLNNVSEYLRE